MLNKVGLRANLSYATMSSKSSAFSDSSKASNFSKWFPTIYSLVSSVGNQLEKLEALEES